ncbi:lectin BRA-3-like [Saccostrea echinata]|uniref:lectin BRA-3-like n=1 Tax=Saccostrea echinata TaxID=191078 RepID=UPI002A821DAC|nr:lectin BRA-3-like [Saccostrea echinata]
MNISKLFMVIGVYLIFLAFVCTEATPCTNGWVLYGEKCYFYSTFEETWNAASAYCQAFNSKLAEPTTQEEVVFLSQQAVQTVNDSTYFIGVTDAFLEGEWVYASSRIPLKVTIPWTNTGSDHNQEKDFVAIDTLPPVNGQYIKKTSKDTSKFICEYSLEYVS